MAALTEVSEEIYVLYESGTVDLPFTFMHKCAKGFGVEITVLLEGGVCAAPDKVRGQVVKAHTAPYKYPRIVEFRTELPKTISGKIMRNKL